MAKILFTAVVADMRNKLNGSVFSKNRYGSYVRTKVTPVNPQTGFQQAQRQALGSLSSGWRGLTQAQRQGWIDAAPSFPIIDIYGNSQILSGQALYVQLNLNLTVAGQTLITDAPSPDSIPSMALTAVAGAAGTPALTATFDISTVPAGYTLVVYCTPLINVGRLFVKNRYRVIGTETLTAGVANLLAKWNTRFGALVAAKNVFVTARLISNTSGQAGVPVSNYATIAA